jgi:hypothetical protein
MAEQQRSTGSIDIEGAREALKDLYRSTWVADLHANLIAARNEGLLPKVICPETLEWHSPRVISEQLTIQLNAYERLEKALGIDIDMSDDRMSFSDEGIAILAAEQPGQSHAAPKP